MKPTFKPNREMTIHNDNTVSFWSVYRQVWERTPIYSILIERHDEFAAMPQTDRDKLNKAWQRIHKKANK